VSLEPIQPHQVMRVFVALNPPFSVDAAIQVSDNAAHGWDQVLRPL